MYNDFIVKVFRYWEEENGSRGWDGWYFSKVYAIDGNEFLVYDNGDCSAYNGEEEFCETGFNWVDFTATMDRCGESGRQPMVEPLVPFYIVEFMADRKTEPTISKMEQVDKDINVRSKDEPKLSEIPTSKCHYEPTDEPQTDAEIPKNALRSDCTGCRFVGTYDTEFPCANCVRKNKDYYSAMQTGRSK